MKEIQIYTDGASLPTNPGPGGWAAIILDGDDRKELTGGFRWTTNNRMEIMAVLKSLESLSEPCLVEVFSDSMYVVNAISKWIVRWKQNDWMRKAKSKRNSGLRKTRVLNSDLWKRIDELCQYHIVKMQWVRGHNGDKENERADALANGIALLEPNEIDVGYFKT